MAYLSMTLNFYAQQVVNQVVVKKLLKGKAFFRYFCTSFSLALNVKPRKFFIKALQTGIVEELKSIRNNVRNFLRFFAITMRGYSFS
jgi:hypothetical protein